MQLPYINYNLLEELYKKQTTDPKTIALIFSKNQKLNSLPTKTSQKNPESLGFEWFKKKIDEMSIVSVGELEYYGQGEEKRKNLVTLISNTSNTWPPEEPKMKKRKSIASYATG